MRLGLGRRGARALEVSEQHLAQLLADEPPPPQLQRSPRHDGQTEQQLHRRTEGELRLPKELSTIDLTQEEGGHGAVDDGVGVRLGVERARARARARAKAKARVRARVRPV